MNDQELHSDFISFIILEYNVFTGTKNRFRKYCVFSFHASSQMICELLLYEAQHQIAVVLQRVLEYQLTQLKRLC